MPDLGTQHTHTTLKSLHLPWASPPEVSTAIARPSPILVGLMGSACAMVLELKLAEGKRP